MPSRRELVTAFAIWPWSRGRLNVAGVRFTIRRNGQSRWRFLHIHGDEATARDVLNEHIRQSPGTAVFVEGSERAVTIEGAKIDPNRMFSREGAARSLARLNPGLSEPAVANILRKLDRERRKLLDVVLPRDGGVLVALHNNSRGYSIQSEIPISDQASLKRPDDPHNFLLVTSPADFAKLEASPFNCVLQRNAPPPDDGSLSRVAAARGLRYVNIEAATGEHKAQKAMLDWIRANLPDRGNIGIG